MPTQTQPIKVSDIVIKDRGRSAKEYGDFKTLAKSIKDVGLIHCIVLSMQDGVPHLVAGGRRMKAIKHLEIEELHHGLTLTPGKAGYVFQTELTETQRKEAELNENLHRLDMTWLDQVMMIETVHELKAAAGGKSWGQRETAAVLGPGYGKTNVGYALKVAKAIRKGDKDILKCKSLMEALQYLTSKKENAVLAELQRRVTANVKPMTKPSADGLKIDTSSLLQTFSIPTKGQPTAEAKPLGTPAVDDVMDKLLSGSVPNIQSKPAPVQRLDPVRIPLSQMFILGDALEDKHDNARVLQSLPDAFIDHVVTDIPYGIDMSNLDEQQIASVAAQHDVQQNIDMMEPFLREAFRVTKPGGFCVFCFDLDHWNYIQRTSKAIGWKVQDWPVLACKTSPCKNQAPQYNTTKNYEAIAYLRRDAKSTLRRTVTSSWRPYDFAAERKVYNNPFAKPFSLWRDIYNDIAFQGQSVLDPFAGECSAGRAAVNCGLVPYGVEISETHYNAGMKHMREVYNLVHQNNCVFE